MRYAAKPKQIITLNLKNGNKVHTEFTDQSLQALIQNLHRLELQVISRNQAVFHTAHLPTEADAVAASSVAVRVDDLLDTVLFSEVCEGAVHLSNGRGRVVQEHDVLAVACLHGLVEGLPETVHLTLSDGPEMLRCVLAFPTDAFGADQGVVLVSIEVVLQEVEPRVELFIEPGSLLRIPELVMIAAQENLASGECLDEGEVLPAFLQIASPGVVAGDDDRIILRENLNAVIADLPLMILPYGIELIHRLMDGSTQVEVTHCIESHNRYPTRASRIGRVTTDIAVLIMIAALTSLQSR